MGNGFTCKGEHDQFCLALEAKKNHLNKVEVSVEGKPPEVKTFVFISLVSLAIMAMETKVIIRQ